MANYSAKKTPEPSEAENTLSRRVYNVLRDDILAGRLKPGERLVRKTLASRLGVSTIPVIEALYMLEIDGYVENRALCGCRVRTLTIEEVDDDLMLREALECQSARLCAEKATAESIDRLMKRAVQVDRFIRAGYALLDLITFFTAGVGVSTLPLQIYSMIKIAVTPEVNAVSTLLMLLTLVLVVAASRMDKSFMKGGA